MTAVSQKARNRDKKKLLQAVGLLKTLSHPLRLSILCDLAEGGEMTAGQIVDSAGDSYSQSQISQYLGTLRALDLVRTRREGQTIWYRIKSEEVKRILAALHDLYC